MNDGLRSLGDIIGSGFKELERRAEEVSQLTRRVRALLNGEEKNHVISATVQAGTLVVLMDSAAWCAQVRYQQDTLRRALGEQNETPFTRIRVRVGAPGP